MPKDTQKKKRLKQEQEARRKINKGKKAETEITSDKLTDNQGKAASVTAAIRDIQAENMVFLLNASLDELQEKSFSTYAEPKNSFEKDMREPVVAYRNWRYTAAARGFLALLDKYPENGTLYYYIALSFSYLAGGVEYSVRFFEKALEYNDSLEIMLDYGNILRHLKRYDAAVAVLEAAREKYYNDGNAAFILLHIYQKTDKERFRVAKAESVRRGRMHFNRLIREWETPDQLLKPVREEYV